MQKWVVYVWGSYDSSVVGPFDSAAAASQWAEARFPADSVFQYEVFPLEYAEDVDV